MDNSYKLMSIFDNGLSLFSDTQSSYFPLSNSMRENYSKITSKPFSSNFDYQVEVCAKMYGSQLKIDLEEEQLVSKIMDNVKGYTLKERKRVLTVLENSLRRHKLERRVGQEETIEGTDMISWD